MGEIPDLEQIYREHHVFVWRIVRRLGVPQSAVDDAVQEVFIVLHRRQADFDLSSSIRGLLYGIARRVAKAQRTPLAQRPLQLRPVRDPSPDPEVAVETAQRARLVQEVLGAMDEGKRMTFVLADVEGMSVAAISRCHGVNVNTAYARLRAARALLKRAIDRHQARQEREVVRARAR